jgi:Ni/Co efflux regulator RcnB
MFAPAPTAVHKKHTFKLVLSYAQAPQIPQRLKILNPLEFNMKQTAIVCAVLAASMLAGPITFAQGDYRPGGRNDQGQRNDERDRRGSDVRSPNNNGNNGRGNAYGRNNRNDRADRGERGAGPDHGYYRGDRMPPQYRTRQYVVEDWRGHQLSAPPRGYHWVQSGGDYVLVAIATGIILQLLLNN